MRNTLQPRATERKDNVVPTLSRRLQMARIRFTDAFLRLLDGQKPDGNGMAQRLLTQENVKEALETAAPNGFWDADGFDYRGEFEKLWGLK